MTTAIRFEDVGDGIARRHMATSKLSADRAAELVEAIAERRDRQAFAELYRYYLPRLKGFLMRGGADVDAAQEAAQEALILLWRKAATFNRHRASVGSWLFTIARNKRIDLVRSHRQRTIETDDWLAFYSPMNEEPDAGLPAAQLAERLRTLLHKLPANQQLVIRKAFVEDKTHAVIAEELGLPLGTVKSRIRMSLQRLRAAMELELK